MRAFVIGLLFCTVGLTNANYKPGQYAAILREFGGPEKFTIEDNWEIPEDFADDECWLLVKAAAVYPWDVKARHNNGSRKRMKTPVVIGQEVSGIVMQCGKNVTHIKQADRVFAKMPMYEGGYKQIVLTKGNETYLLPDDFTHEEGAVSFYPFVTTHKALVHRGQISRGKSILVIGGVRDTGAAAIQIAKAYGCYPIVATAGTEDGLDHLMKIGATHVVNHNNEGYRSTAVAMNHFKKFDIILNRRFPLENYIDMEFAKNPGGYCLYHGEIDIETETHGLQYFRETFGHSPSDINASIQHVVKGIHNGLYRPHVNKTFYLDEIADAHREVENEDVIGDMVLTKVHRDQYIHLSNCPNFGNKSIPKPVTYIGTINFSDPTPSCKIGRFRFNFTPADSAEMRSVSQYLWTLAVEELYDGTTPTPSEELVTYSFESYENKDLNLTAEESVDFTADSVSKVLSRCSKERKKEKNHNRTRSKRRK